MDRKVAAIPPAPESASPQFQSAATPAPSEPVVGKGPDPVEMRLVIEMDKASGSFIYKTINRLTGEVILQLPRAEVLKMKDGGQYEAGAVIRTKA
jgi:flagellar protein FlaG